MYTSVKTEATSALRMETSCAKTCNNLYIHIFNFQGEGVSVILKAFIVVTIIFFLPKPCQTQIKVYSINALIYME